MIRLCFIGSKFSPILDIVYVFDTNTLTVSQIFCAIILDDEYAIPFDPIQSDPGAGRGILGTLICS